MTELEWGFSTSKSFYHNNRWIDKLGINSNFPKFQGKLLVIQILWWKVISDFDISVQRWSDQSLEQYGFPFEFFWGYYFASFFNYQLGIDFSSFFTLQTFRLQTSFTLQSPPFLGEICFSKDKWENFNRRKVLQKKKLKSPNIELSSEEPFWMDFSRGTAGLKLFLSYSKIFYKYEKFCDDVMHLNDSDLSFFVSSFHLFSSFSF